MLKGPLLLLFFSDLMYVIISSSEVKSNLNDCSIGFVRKSSYVFCVGIIPFSIYFGILQKKWLNVFAIWFFSVINFPLLFMFLIYWVFFFCFVDNLFDTCLNFIQVILIVFKKGFVVVCFTQSSYFIKRIPVRFKNVVQFLFFYSIFSPNTFSVNLVLFFNGFQYSISNPWFFIVFLSLNKTQTEQNTNMTSRLAHTSKLLTWLDSTDSTCFYLREVYLLF